MAKKSRLTANEKNLIRRYLVWCYKTTKEELDRIDRKFTQLEVDHFILKGLEQLPGSQRSAMQKYTEEFKAYIAQKKEAASVEKFNDSTQTQYPPKYLYLQSRFQAIEKAIQHFLGKTELNKIESFYEEEMTRRILTAREHS